MQLGVPRPAPQRQQAERPRALVLTARLRRHEQDLAAVGRAEAGQVRLRRRGAGDHLPVGVVPHHEIARRTRRAVQLPADGRRVSCKGSRRRRAVADPPGPERRPRGNLKQRQLARGARKEGPCEHRRSSVAHLPWIEVVVADREGLAPHGGRLRRAGRRGAGGPGDAGRDGRDVQGDRVRSEIDGVDAELVRRRRQRRLHRHRGGGERHRIVGPPLDEAHLPGEQRHGCQRGERAGRQHRVAAGVDGERGQRAVCAGTLGVAEDVDVGLGAGAVVDDLERERACSADVRRAGVGRRRRR